MEYSLVYPGLYASLVYMPGIHPWVHRAHTVRGVLPGTPSPAVRVRREGALGYNLKIIRAMRRIEPSQLPKVC